MSKSLWHLSHDPYHFPQLCFGNSFLDILLRAGVAKKRGKRSRGALWFGFGMAPKCSCIEGVVPNATMSRDGALGKWLNHEGSDIISALIH